MKNFSKLVVAAATVAVSLGFATSAHACPPGQAGVSFVIAPAPKGAPKAPKGQVYAVLKSMTGCGMAAAFPNGGVNVALNEANVNGSRVKGMYELRVQTGTGVHAFAKTNLMMDWDGQLILCIREDQFKGPVQVNHLAGSSCGEGNTKWIGNAWIAQPSPPIPPNAEIPDKFYTPKLVQNTTAGKTVDCVTFNSWGAPLKISATCVNAFPKPQATDMMTKWERFTYCVQTGHIAAQKARQETYSCAWNGVPYTYSSGYWTLIAGK